MMFSSAIVNMFCFILFVETVSRDNKSGSYLNLSNAALVGIIAAIVCILSIILLCIFYSLCRGSSSQSSVAPTRDAAAPIPVSTVAQIAEVEHDEVPVAAAYLDGGNDHIYQSTLV
jgi:hypothetical protein